MGHEDTLQFETLFERICDQTDIQNSTDLARALEISSAAVSKQKIQNKFPASWAIQIATKFSLDLNFLVFGAKQEIPSIDERQRLHDSVKYFIAQQYGHLNLHNNDAILNIVVGDILSLIGKYASLSEGE